MQKDTSAGISPVKLGCWRRGSQQNLSNTELEAEIKRQLKSKLGVVDRIEVLRSHS